MEKRSEFTKHDILNRKSQNSLFAQKFSLLERQKHDICCTFLVLLPLKQCQTDGVINPKFLAVFMIRFLGAVSVLPYYFCCISCCTQIFCKQIFFFFKYTKSMAKQNFYSSAQLKQNSWFSETEKAIFWNGKSLSLHPAYTCIDQFGFKKVISLRPPYLGGFQVHDKRWVFQTMSCFSSGTGVRLGHCIIFCHALGSPPVWRPPRSWNWIGLYIVCFCKVCLFCCCVSTTPQFPSKFPTSKKEAVDTQEKYGIQNFDWSALSIKRKITSSEWHSLKSKVLKWLLIAHTWAILRVTKHI